MAKFPEAVALKVFCINGSLYQQVRATEGLDDPESVRATINPGAKGEKTSFFVPFDPSNASLSEENL